MMMMMMMVITQFFSTRYIDNNDDDHSRARILQSCFVDRARFTQRSKKCLRFLDELSYVFVTPPINSKLGLLSVDLHYYAYVPHVLQVRHSLRSLKDRRGGSTSIAVQWSPGFELQGQQCSV